MFHLYTCGTAVFVRDAEIYFPKRATVKPIKIQERPNCAPTPASDKACPQLHDSRIHPRIICSKWSD